MAKGSEYLILNIQYTIKVWLGIFPFAQKTKRVLAFGTLFVTMIKYIYTNKAERQIYGFQLGIYRKTGDLQIRLLQ